MKTFGVALVAGLLVAADKPADDAAREEAKKLEGAWVIVSAEAQGMKTDLKDFEIDEVLIKDGTMYFRRGGVEVQTFLFSLDPSQKPKAMDWFKGKDTNRLPGIYALDGDELRMCVPMIPARPVEDFRPQRPESFDTKGKPQMCLTARRKKG